MAYGRIDVYWPDGPVESYQLEKPSVAVGRSPGNDIVLDTNAVSRYHVSISRRDQNVVLEDLESVNGTYVEGIRIQPRDPMVLRGGEEIQVGDIRLIFIPQQEVDTPTRPMLPELDDTQQIELEQDGLKITLEPPAQPVTPGAYIQSTLTIENTGDATERYVIEVDGVPPEWVRVDRKQLVLDRGASAPIIISFKPLRRSESAPGEYPISVRVKADSQVVETSMRLVVRPYSGFGMVLGTPQITAGQPFELYVENHGTSWLPLVISGASPDNNMTFNIQPPSLTLQAGETRIIHGYVQSIRKPLLGSKIEQRFDILVRSKDASGFLAAVQGTLVEQAVIPLWVPTLLIPLLLILLIGGAVLGMVFISRPRTPIFNIVDVNPKRVTVGDPVTVQWDVSDADIVVLRMDGGTIELDPKDRQYTQSVTTAGNVTITIEAHNGEQVVTRDLPAITVVQLFKINAFVVSPNPMLRYVAQDVTVSWNVEGANTVSFVGLEGLTGKPDVDNQPATGQMVLNGTPRDTIQLTMIATAPDGKRQEQSVIVEVRNPICTVNVDRSTIYSGPGTNYPPLRNYPRGSELMPDGRDQSGQWLHLAPSPDPQAWVRVSDVQCTGFNPGALITIAAIPPVPTAIPTRPPSTATADDF